MNTKHTPGPWDYDYYGDHVAFVGNDNRKDYSFRVEYCGGMPEDEQIENNHLIAAAPDLLSALNLLLDKLHAHAPSLITDLHTESAIAKAEMAIAKAKGAE